MSFLCDHKDITEKKVTDTLFENYEDTMPLYETLVYNNNDALILKTKMINDVPIYRLYVHGDGELEFNAIGNRSKKYTIAKNEKTVSLIMHA
jgi:hypothetical protein